MAVNRVLMERWAHASRHLQSDEAAALWEQLMREWLKPLIADQSYLNDLLTRRMVALERKKERRAIDDAEWDSRHEETGR